MKVHYHTLEWVQQAFEDGRIDRSEFEILYFCCCRMTDWSERRVESYSAEQVCRFWKLDADLPTLKRFQRVFAKLWAEDMVRRDYQKGEKRPYRVWLPLESPSPGSVENAFCPMSLMFVAPNVAVPRAVPSTNGDTSTPTTEKMSLSMSQQNGGEMSSNKQCNPKDAESQTDSAEKAPLRPPQGERSPQGFAQPPLGLKGVTGKATTLSPEQVECLHTVALLYAEFSSWLYDKRVLPNADHIYAVLWQKFHPAELLYAQTARFSPMQKQRKSDMAHFFRKSAVQAMRLTRSRKWWWGDEGEFFEAALQNLAEAGYKVGADFNEKWDEIQESWNNMGTDFCDTCVASALGESLVAYREAKGPRRLAAEAAAEAAAAAAAEAQREADAAAKERQRLAEEQAAARAAGEQRRSAWITAFKAIWATRLDLDDWLTDHPHPPEVSKDEVEKLWGEATMYRAKSAKRTEQALEASGNRLGDATGESFEV